MSVAERDEIRLLYDRQCPVCNFYSRRVELDAGELVRVDAREDSALKKEAAAAGFDVDKGMAVEVDNTLYYGSDALRALAMLSSRRGFFNRVMAGTFRYRWIANVIYPVLAAGRRVLLWLLRRPRINQGY